MIEQFNSLDENDDNFLDSFDRILTNQIEALDNQKNKNEAQLETIQILNQINLEKKDKEQHEIQDKLKSIQISTIQSDQELQKQVQLSYQYYELQKQQKIYNFILRIIDILEKKKESINNSDNSRNKEEDQVDIYDSFIDESYIIYILKQIDENDKDLKTKYDSMQQKLENEYLKQFFKQDIQKLKKMKRLVQKYGVEEKLGIQLIENTMKDLRVGIQYDISKWSQNVQQFNDMLIQIEQILSKLQKNQEKQEVFKVILGEDYYEIIVKYILENYIHKQIDGVLKQSDCQMFLEYSCNFYESLINFKPFKNNEEEIEFIYIDYKKIYYEKEYHNLQKNLEYQFQIVRNIILEENNNSDELKKLLNRILDEKYNQKISKKIQNLNDLLLSIEIEHFFKLIQHSCHRFQLMYSEIDKNQKIQKLLIQFVEKFRTLLIFIIEQLYLIVPDPNRKIQLNEQFYVVVNRINTLIQRVDLVYQSYCIDQKNNSQITQQKQEITQNIQMQVNKLVQHSFVNIYLNFNRLLNKNKLSKNKTDGNSGQSQLASSFLNKYLNQLVDLNYNVQNTVSSFVNQIFNIMIEYYCSVKKTPDMFRQILIDCDFYREYLLINIGSEVFDQTNHLNVNWNDQFEFMLNLIKLSQINDVYKQDLFIKQYLQNRDIQIIQQYIKGH